MREILFRGKLRGGRWAEGNLEVKKDFVCIITPDDTPLGCYGQVDPDTVGQYTGLTDEYGKKIFEGDIIDFLGIKGVVDFECGAFGVVIRPYVDYDTMLKQVYELTKKNNLDCCYNDNFISLWEIYWNYDCEEDCCHVIKVIGNIHDNPELIEGGVT